MSKLTNTDKFLRELHDTKRYYMLKRDEKTSRYVGRCIKTVKWMRRNGITGHRAVELTERLNPKNFYMYIKKGAKK